MKQLVFLFLPAFLLAACTPSAVGGSSEAEAVFEQNCVTARALIRDFDNEDIPAIRAHFADSARWRPTAFGKTEPASLEDKVNGWNFDWEAAIPATDSTERKAVTITYYESWDFDADGKIWLTQIFGDETAAMQALNGM